MHTDEYEISLSRELDVCKGSIRAIERFLAKMEKKYNRKTESFMEDFRNGRLSASSKDFTAWVDHSEALKRWQKLKSEYEALYYAMKI